MRTRVLVALGLIVAGCCAPRNVPVVTVPPDRDTTWTLSGLDAPVRMVTDRNGIPHLAARTRRDLYFAWGFASARDRLWQLEYNRRAARGTLSEWFGNRALRQDGGSQLFELATRGEAIAARDLRGHSVAVAM